MNRPAPTAESTAGSPQVRCAIYTRKSTSEGLESDFNTLDAQREAAEFYIRAMRGEGWVALPERYDDGGFTGANIERPALQRLLADIDAGEVDAVVVYKVDRLSRSLLDFAQLLARFEEKSVGFVSTTQQFNTRDAMGRLTLNIVVSFAQFEREMIADRTRDKMGAARKRGKWLGSRPPLGYAGDRERMRLVIVPEEADQVRKIFRFYLRLGSAALVAHRLNELKWERKRTFTRAGRPVGGGRWTEKSVHMVLRNPLYVGAVVFKGKRYEGEHEAIVDEALFEAVQRRLTAKSCGRGPRRGRNPEYLLAGILSCGLCGDPMTTSSAKGRRDATYRYYSCRNHARRTEVRCTHPRLSAPEVEDLVVSRVRELCTDPAMRKQIAARMQLDEPELARWVQEQRAEAESQRAALRAEAEQLLRTLGKDATGRASELLAERISEIEAELEPVRAKIARLDGQFIALQQAAEQIQETATLLAGFDAAWEGFTASERRGLILLLVERVVVNEPAGTLEIVFHDLGDAAPTVPTDAQEASS